MIRLTGVRLQAGRFELRDVSFEVPRGGYALVIGPTGSGKTTLLEAVAGHTPLSAGRVELHGRDVTHLPPERRGVGFVYQQYHLFPHLSVRENIAYGLRARRNGRRDARAEDHRVEEIAARLELSPLLGRRIPGLSGGEQQRVALARALAPRPSILLLDEPLAAVDPATRAVLREELRALHEQEGVTTLHVTHDFDEALRLGDVVAVLADGRVAQYGPPEQVFRYPNSAFVAQFVGAGNVIAGRVVRAPAAPSEAARQTPDELRPGEGPFRACFIADTLTLDVIADREGPCHAVIRPEDILLRFERGHSSARNHLAARVARLERLGPVTRVHLETAERPLIAAITTAAADEMGLSPGREVIAAIKATAVHLM